MLAVSPIEQQVQRIIEPSLHELGYELVRIRLGGGGKRPTLQIMLDRLDGKDIDLDDCERASRQVSALLDVNDPIHERYDLEMSSAGLDRPLTRLKDFETYKGRKAKITLSLPQDGRKRFAGVLLGVENETVRLQAEEVKEPVCIAFSDITSARLELDDSIFKKNKP